MLSSPLFKSERILQIINMSAHYRVRPSEMMGIDDDYVAFCFNEACAYISMKVENGEQVVFKKKYKSLKDLYKHYQ